MLGLVAQDISFNSIANDLNPIAAGVQSKAAFKE
jgi:hypothetical protein